MKRVCVIRQKYYTRHKNLKRNPETLVRHGFEVDVICLGLKDEKKTETINGVTIHRIFMGYRRGSILWYVVDYARFFLMAAARLTALSFRKRYDVVEVNTLPDFLVFITLIAKLSGSKIVLHMNENGPALFASSFSVGPGHPVVRVLRLFEKMSAKYADRIIISDGPPYKKVLESRGIPGEKITTVLNVPDDVFTTSPVSSNNGEHFQVAVVSTLIQRYGVQTIISAIPLLLPTIPNLKVDVIGWGEYRTELERQARELKVEDYVNFTGWVSTEELVSKISAAQVAVAPMLHDVGVSNKVFEYFAMGTPAVVSALPSLLATFDSDCLVFYEPGNEKDLSEKIIALYSDPERRKALSRKATEFYQLRRWEIMQKEYVKVYEECTAPRANRTLKKANAT